MRLILYTSFLAALGPLRITEIHWNFSATDPASFNLLLMNSTEPFDLGLIAIIGENLQKEFGQITTQLPTVPAIEGYLLHANDDAGHWFARSSVFAIEA
ncbi:hypothetical protein B0H13DRAFT_2337287 [Mycena leptocephala]|nr:hypothetical protein B0H13DRAFT_2337287 [Mycena leptocephala]